MSNFLIDAFKESGVIPLQAAYAHGAVLPPTFNGFGSYGGYGGYGAPGK